MPRPPTARGVAHRGAWTALALLLALSAAATACDTFPYTECDQFTLPEQLVVDRFQITGQSLSFTIRTTTENPIAGGRTECDQTVDTIEINSFQTCMNSEIYAYKGAQPLETLGFQGSGQQVVFSLRLNMTWAEIKANAPTITLILGSRPGTRKCNWWQKKIQGPNALARSWAVLNTTAVQPIDMAFFSKSKKCCPRPSAVVAAPLPSPTPSPAPMPCKACATMSFAVENAANVQGLAQSHCENLAKLLNTDPVLTSLVPPEPLTFACNPAPEGSGPATHITFQACAWHERDPVNNYVNASLAILDLFSMLVAQELGPRLGLEAAASCSYLFLMNSSCGSSQAAQGICPQTGSPPPSPPPGDNSWNFAVGSKQEAMAQAQVVSQEMGLPPNTNQPGPVMVGVGSPSALTTKKLKAMFADWCRQYGLASPTDQVAFRNFRSNMAQVLAVNLDPNVSWWASGNRFSHMSQSNFAQTYLGALSPKIAHQRRALLSNTDSANTTEEPQTPSQGDKSSADSKDTKSDNTPATGDWTFPDFNWPDWNFPNWNSPNPSPKPSPTPSPQPSPVPSPRPSPTPSPATVGVNWVSRGMVTKVREQGSCGGCWAFTATSLIESAYLMTGRGRADSLDLSEEHLLSCVNPDTSPYNGYGCDGGWIDNAINYVYWSSQTKESIWPYVASVQGCRSVPSTNSGDSVKLGRGAQQVSPSRSEEALKNAVLNAPAGILFMVDQSFQNYRGGIYTPTTCNTQVNHAMVAAGWGYDSSSRSYYWLIRNSWGAAWGESGYVRVKMTGDGTGPCGMYQWSYQAPLNAFTSTPLTNV